MLQRNYFNFLLLPLYWVAIVFLYHKGHTGALVDDGNAGLVDFALEGWAGIKHNYGMTSLYYFHDLVNNIWFEIFGLNTKAWFLLTASLHALNSWLIFINMKTFYQRCNLKHGGKIALFGSLMFLLSPYQSENIIWAATHHYGFALLFFMLILRLVLKLNKENLIQYSVLIILLYCVSLTTLEQTLVFPGVFVALFILMKFFNPSTAMPVKVFIVYVIIPQAILIILYFVSTKLIKGSWIPHYGSTHIENISLANCTATFLQFIVKHLGFIHFFDYGIRDEVYSFIVKKTTLSVAIFIAVNSILAIFLYIRNRKSAIVFAGLWVCAIVLFLPVLNLYFMYLFQYENDRMGYFGSIILCQIFPLVFFSLLPLLGYICCIAWLIFALHFSKIAVSCWQNAGHFYHNCVNTLPQQSGRLFFLNVPLKYQSIYIFRKAHRIGKVYQLFYNKHNSEQLKPVAWMLFHSPNDKLEIHQLTNHSIQVIVRANGVSWWMFNEFGALDYENDDCIFDVDEYGTGYTLTIKNPKPDDSFWITTGEGFQQFHFLNQ